MTRLAVLLASGLCAGLAQAETVVTCTVADFHSFDREDTKFAQANKAKRFTITVRTEEIHVRSTSEEFDTSEKTYPILLRDIWGVHGVTARAFALDTVSVNPALAEGRPGGKAVVSVQSPDYANVWKLVCAPDSDAG